MINSRPIRHIATAFDIHLFVTAEFERFVSIWRIDNGEHQISFETILDFGGHRLAISPDGQLCVAGAYYIHGISAYRTLDGSTIWNRKNLKKVQWLAFDPVQGTLLAGFDERPLHILDINTGETIETWRGVRHKWISPYDKNVYLLDGTRLTLHSGSSKPISIERRTFAILDVTFGHQAVYLTESGGPLRAIDCSGGSLLWEYVPEGGSHFLRIGYNELTGTLFGVLWQYERGGPKTLVEFEPQTGQPINQLVLGNLAETAFGGRGSRLVTSDGCIWTLDKQANKRFQRTALRFAPRCG